MMSIDIAMNGDTIHRIELIQRGPVRGIDLDEGDPEGWRHYDWSHLSRLSGKWAAVQFGELIHKRSDGALVLAAMILRHISE